MMKTVSANIQNHFGLIQRFHHVNSENNKDYLKSVEKEKEVKKIVIVI